MFKYYPNIIGKSLLEATRQKTISSVSKFRESGINEKPEEILLHIIAYAPPRTVGVWVREVMSPQSRQFLASLSAQNGRFDTSNWCIRHAAPCKGGHFLLIGMDEESHSRIQYPAKIYYYTDLLSFTFEPPPYQRGHPDGEAK